MHHLWKLVFSKTGWENPNFALHHLWSFLEDGVSPAPIPGDLLHMEHLSVRDGTINDLKKSLWSESKGGLAGGDNQPNGLDVVILPGVRDLRLGLTAEVMMNQLALVRKFILDSNQGNNTCVILPTPPVQPGDGLQKEVKKLNGYIKNLYADVPGPKPKLPETDKRTNLPNCWNDQELAWAKKIHIHQEIQKFFMKMYYMHCRQQLFRNG